MLCGLPTFWAFAGRVTYISSLTGGPSPPPSLNRNCGVRGPCRAPGHRRLVSTPRPARAWHRTAHPRLPERCFMGSTRALKNFPRLREWDRASRTSRKPPPSSLPSPCWTPAPRVVRYGQQALERWFRTQTRDSRRFWGRHRGTPRDTKWGVAWTWDRSPAHRGIRVQPAAILDTRGTPLWMWVPLALPVRKPPFFIFFYIVF